MSDPYAPPSTPPPPSSSEVMPSWLRLGHWPHVLEAVGLGVLHGLLARLCFGLDAAQGVLGIMTASFIFLVPFSIGAVSVGLMPRERWNIGLRVLGAVVPAWIALTCALMLAWEGIICIFLWLPLYTVLAIVGGLCAELVMAIVRTTRNRQLSVLGLAMLPYLVAPIETQIPLAEQRRVVENTIDIHASEATIWQHIIRVREFAPEEHHFTWTHALGFPRPVEATLSAEGVGGVRHATFEGDVLFVETVTRWEPAHRLSFGIKADTSAIPASTLDEHVTIGGPYFDVLTGEYELEPLGGGDVRLHLRSTHRLSTPFNAYASLWTDFIMFDVQRYILEILKTRCEREPV